MITYNEILKLDTFDMEQNTPEWHQARMGVITASVADVILTDDRRAPFPENIEIITTGKRGVNVVAYGSQSFTGTKAECADWVRDQLPVIPSLMKMGYLRGLVGQIATGIVPEDIDFKQARWGHENEPFAREAYEARELVSVTQCGFIYKDESMRCGISPDGLIIGSDGSAAYGLEIKNPMTTNVHLAVLQDDEIKPEYITQVQYSLWVTGLKKWVFCCYDHRMRGKPENRLFTKVFTPDPVYFDRFDNEIPKFIADMDSRLERLGFVFGDQWRDL